MIEVSADNKTESARIMVIGVGGGGNNAVNSMVEDGVLGVTYACLNTDKQALERCQADYHLQIGQQLTKGLGAGAKPEIGEAAALENEDEIRSLVRDQDMVIVTCGMGGGTGTGGAPVIAKITRELGILTVGVVTRPFLFEAKTRMRNAISGIEKLRQYTDTLIVISNNKLLEIVDRKTTMPEALKKSDMILKQTIQGITDLISRPAMINLDFADVTTIMKDKGTAYIGIGTGHGENRTIEAVENALNSPLLETSIDGATHVLLNISGDVTLWDANEGAERVQGLVSEDANIIFGSMYDDSEPDMVTVTIIATGVDRDGEEPPKEKYPSRQRTQSTSGSVNRGSAGRTTNFGGGQNYGQQGQGAGNYMSPTESVENYNQFGQDGGGYMQPTEGTGAYHQSGQESSGYMQPMEGSGSYSQLGQGNSGYMSPIEGVGAYSQSGQGIGQDYNYSNTGYYGTQVGQSTGRMMTEGNSGSGAKITEFQSRKQPETELKFSTIQSKNIHTSEPETEENDYYNREESNSSFDIPDFLKRIRRKR